MEKKESKFKTFDAKKFRKVEFIVSAVTGIIFLIMLGFAVCNMVFIPIALVTFAMFLFSICYYYIEDKDKKKIVYILFTIGVLLILGEVIFTLVNIL